MNRVFQDNIERIESCVNYIESIADDSDCDISAYVEMVLKPVKKFGYEWRGGHLHNTNGSYLICVEGARFGKLYTLNLEPITGKVMSETDEIVASMIQQIIENEITDLSMARSKILSECSEIRSNLEHFSSEFEDCECD